ncbi:uncharacterized protein LOC102673353 [Apis dorsata]|uniref:uncharacterized protein LOC102673353 n=1 Tax=Apis dorsata TaxID=7462 RepID=UPI00129354D0|nr:uncharacterized protein LOC102673353 [Apis dorsata]
MIRTFIFFDLETTGLITKSCMPKVTELSLIAVSRTAVCNTKDFLPRVLQKLVLPIHPNLNLSKEIETLTGLSNENLCEIQHFNSDVYNLIINFINRQKAPTCFVAYNGNNFDYPIFLSELKTIDKSFSENILSIDMLQLVKDFFLREESKKMNNQINSCNIEVSTLLNDGYDKILSDALDSIINTNNDNKNDTFLKIEKTISHSNNISNTPQTNYYKKMQELNEKTPKNQIIKIQHSDKNFQDRKRSINARRKLDFTNSRPINFKLTNVCKHIFGTEPENAHSAEGDCLTMIRCAIHLGNFFVDWADSNAIPLINHISK